MNSYVTIQPGLRLYKNLLDEQSVSTVLEHALAQLNSQGYHVKKGTCYAHWNYMWGVNDRGNDFFPIFGKNLRKSSEKTGFGKNLHKINLPKLEIRQGSNKKWYEYYTADQNGQKLKDIPSEVRELMSKKLDIPMEKYDCALLNFYEENTFLSRHIDNTEDISAGDIPIISLNLYGKGKFFYSKPSADPNNFLPDDNCVELDTGDVIVFGRQSRYISHRVENSFTSTTMPQRSSLRDPISISRINITFRRAAKLET